MQIERIGSWLEKIPKSRSLIIRDDQYELSELQEILSQAKKRKIKVSLIDSGRLSYLEIETLCNFPFSFYTSDSTRADFSSTVQVAEILRAEKHPVYYFLQNELTEDAPLFSRPEIFTSVFISSREKPQNLNLLAALSEEVCGAGSSFVYYHHGQVEEKLADLSQKLCWIHMSNKFLEEEKEMAILDLLKEIKERKGHLVVHVDRSQSYAFLQLLSDHGAFLIFNLAPIEHSSKLYSLEKHWLRKKLPEQAFYLYKEVMA